MKPNASCHMPLRQFDCLQGCGFVSVPRSNILEVSINPFTGDVHFSYQRSADAMLWLDYIAEQYSEFCVDFERLNHRKATFRDFVHCCEEVAQDHVSRVS